MHNLSGNKNVVFSRNSSTILTFISSIGVVVTSVMVAKATPKAMLILEQKKVEKGEELSKIEIIKCSSTIYLPSMIAGISTIFCIFGANILNRRNQASLISAYSLIDRSYREYKNKLIELYGEDAHENIITSIAVEKAEDINVWSAGLCTCCNLSLEGQTENKKIFYDEYCERYFETTIEQVISAEYHLNRNFALKGEVCLNEFYDFLGLENTDFGSVLGWTVEYEIYWIDFNHRKIKLDDGRECYIIEMPFGPLSEYDE